MAGAKAGASKERERRRRAREYEARQAVHGLQEERRRRDQRFGIGALVVAALVTAGLQVLFMTAGPGGTMAAAPDETPAVTDPTATGPADPVAQPTSTGAAPDPSVAEGRTWTGDLTINGIPLAIELDGAKAPQAVASTVDLARSGFYDGTPCHRLVTAPGANLLQCGDPTGTGTGGPGYQYGPIENAPADGIYPAGTIAMARQGGNGSSMGSQFFITFEDVQLPPDAAGGYTVFGRVTSGLDELRSAVSAPGVQGGGQDGPPAVATAIDSFTVA